MNSEYNKYVALTSFCSFISRDTNVLCSFGSCISDSYQNACKHIVYIGLRPHVQRCIILVAISWCVKIRSHVRLSLLSHLSKYSTKYQTGPYQPVTSCVSRWPLLFYNQICGRLGQVKEFQMNTPIAIKRSFFQTTPRPPECWGTVMVYVGTRPRQRLVRIPIASQRLKRVKYFWSYSPENISFSSIFFFVSANKIHIFFSFCKVLRNVKQSKWT